MIIRAFDDLVVIYDFYREGEATEEEVDNQYDKLSVVDRGP